MDISTNNDSFKKYKKQCELIKNNINGRKLVLRYKSPDFEKALFALTGLKAEKYVTRASNRINSTDTFLDTEIFGQSDKYFLVITEELGWNTVDASRYKNGGYNETKDIVWVSPPPKTVTLDSKQNYYEDDYGNKIETQSDVIIKFTGCNSHIRIGKNVRMPNKEIVIGRDIFISVDDNSSMVNADLTFGKGSKLILGKSVGMGTMSVFINELSTVEIGDKSTLQSGKLRTGRNQKVVIGKDCMFSWDVIFIPHDGHLIYDLKHQKFINNTNGEQRESVVIGDHVWIGGETVLMPNTHIGSGSICGYRCMAKGNYPNNCILAGMPAKVIRKDVAWMRQNYTKNENDILLLNEQYRQLTNIIE